MAGSVNPVRAYDSPRRREQARATRAAILEAARTLFIDRGYVATTIRTIAETARVSPETVYASFRTKRSLLASLVDISIARDDEPVALLDRPWVRQMRAEPDAARRLRILAENGSALLERISPIFEVIRGAATADPEVASLWERYKTQRYAGQRALVGIIGRAPLQDGLTLGRAADILFTIGSPETYRLLTVDRGWSAERFTRWYADTLASLLLE